MNNNGLLVSSIQFMLDWYKQGLTIPEIAQKLSVTNADVERQLIAFGRMKKEDVKWLAV